jgi:hypothetical protein
VSEPIVVVFAPTRPGDAALVCTRWIAEHTLAMLRGENIEPMPVLDGQATRANLESSITHSVTGMALLAHGRGAPIGSSGSRGLVMGDEAVIGADGAPALDRDNLHLTRGRWVHAIACYAGAEFGALAGDAGAACFVGYDCALNVQWEPTDLPAEVEPLMRDLVTVTTRNLVRGVHDLRALKADAARIADEITTWCEEHAEEAGWLMIMAQQLVSRMRYYPAK